MFGRIDAAIVVHAPPARAIWFSGMFCPGLNAPLEAEPESIIPNSRGPVNVFVASMSAVILAKDVD